MGLGARWDRLRGRPKWKQRELAARAPPRADRHKARPYLRSGETAPDPELARLTVATAREDLRPWENPWQRFGYFLFIAALLFNITKMTVAGNASAGVLYVFLPVIAALAVYHPLTRRRAARPPGDGGQRGTRRAGAGPTRRRQGRLETAPQAPLTTDTTGR